MYISTYRYTDIRHRSGSDFGDCASHTSFCQNLSQTRTFRTLAKNLMIKQNALTFRLIEF